jgi:hypothetical protein
VLLQGEALIVKKENGEASVGTEEIITPAIGELEVSMLS